MQPLKLTISGSFWDSQIYAGRLYLFTDTGAIRTLDWDLVVSEWQIDPALTAGDGMRLPPQRRSVCE
jgi:hypothetical protein